MRLLLRAGEDEDSMEKKKNYVIGRRAFIETSALAFGGLSLVGLSGDELRPLFNATELHFDSQRARPGQQVGLEVLGLPGTGSGRLSCVLYHQGERGGVALSRIELERKGNQATGSFEVPVTEISEAERANEAYVLVAGLVDGELEPVALSAGLEVVVSPFHFGF